MGKPEKKLKKILLIMGIAGAVYGGFRYLLPLVIPFLAAFWTALWLRPSARFLERRLFLRIGGKERHAPAWFFGGVQLLLLLLGLFGLLYLGGGLLVSQLCRLFGRLPEWLSGLDFWLTGALLRLEGSLGLADRSLVELGQEAVEELRGLLKAATMPALMSNSLTAAGKAAEVLVFLFLYFVGVILCLQEMEELREKRSRSLFHREISLLSRRLSDVGNAWLRTQLFLMGAMSLLCVLALFLIKNPYSLLLGVGIGVLDALPIFGAGAVLIPWFLMLFAGKQWGKGIVILALYLVCYFLRQFTETKVMGNRVGLSALETLISMYAGLRLFGAAGFLLGPMGLLIIQDLTRVYGEEEKIPVCGEPVVDKREGRD